MRVLLLLNQMPHDPSSGAARSMRIICEMLAGAGLQVEALATTATEIHDDYQPIAILREQGIRAAMQRLGSNRILKAKHRGIAYTILDVGTGLPRDWIATHDAAFHKLHAKTLARFKPDVVFTYGGFPGDVARRKAAREAGAKVVFGLHNMRYFQPGSFVEVDAVLTPSRYMTDRYAGAIGLVSTPLPTPLLDDETVIDAPTGTHITFVNPSYAKGLMVYASLLARIAEVRPDLPLLVYEARGGSGDLEEALRAAGTSVDALPGLTVRPAAPSPRAIFEATRLLLVPSVVEEAAGRVVAEALVNGIPPIVSDRGGLPETGRGAARVVPIPPDVTPKTRTPVAPDVVERWLDAVTTLFDDDDAWNEASRAAADAGRACREAALTPQFVQYFQSVRRMPGVIRRR